MADALDAVSPDVAARTKALMQAVATGGSAGLKAYESGQQALTQGRTDAIGRAQQRAGIIGGPEAQGFEGQAAQVYDRGLSSLATSRTGFEQNMAQLGSAHKNYLDQVAAAVPLVRADTERQLILKKAAIDAELQQQAAKEAKDAEKEAKANKPKLSDILSLSENIGQMYAGPSTLKGTVGPNGSHTEGSADINPNRNWVTDDMMMTAADNAAYNGTSVEFELAKIGAEISGLDPVETAQTLAPSDVKPYLRRTPEATEPVKNVARWANVDEAEARKITADPKYAEARDYGFAWADPSAYEVDKAGKIKGEDDAYNGKTPWEAFLVDLAGYTGSTRTALINEFGPLFSQLGLK